MKKNISINISGIIFHIEEDGYEVLKKYLDSIHKYFSSFEDSSEILSDIESRIAEIFLSKLNEGKQIITAEDVNALVTTMGSVNDFKAVEEEKEQAEAEPETETGNQRSNYQHTAAKQLYRDQNRKIMGGVCAGLANYFNIDAVWVRVFFALLTAAWGLGVLAYIIMWIAIPGSYTLEEPGVSRKLFRDNERKVIGGVSGGLAAYFGFDIIVIRVLFVIFTVFWGFGLIVYIVLWIVCPPAVSITDKMEMQGEPVTLSNIESNLKKNLNLKEDEENVFVKILLFPFRLIGMILTGLGKLIYPLVDVVRVLIGVFIAIMGLSMVLTVLIFSGIVFGLISGSFVPLHLGVPINEASLPIEAMSRAIPPVTMAAAFIGSILPGIFVLLLGISVIAKRIVFSAVVGWSVFALFIVSLLVLSFTIPKIVYAFKEESELKTENLYPIAHPRVVFQLKETGLDEYMRPRVYLHGYEGTEIKVVTAIESQGYSKQIAIENARMVDYHVTLQDSVLLFDSNLKFKPDGIFRGQRAEVNVYVPYDYPVNIDREFRIMGNYYSGNNAFRGNTWTITKENKKLTCLSCPIIEKNKKELETERINNLSDYTELEINGMFDVTIQQQSDTHSVSITGSEHEEKKYTVTQVGKKLLIEYKSKKNYNWKDNPLNFDKTEISITLPELERIKLKGAGQVRIKDFTVEDLDIEIVGAVTMRGDIQANRITANLTGASQLELNGTGQALNAHIEGASGLKAFDFPVQNASVETIGISAAKVKVSGRLEMKEGIGGKISYLGDPSEIIKE